ASARSQAESAFGSSRIYLERRLIDASHVEVQVLGDKHGNVVHLFERDCSVQRRNQKVIEETPCAKISPETREEMTAAAVRLAKGVGYSNAGTVEFLLDGDHEHFYFLEMNTRLQVEHPITEMVTGIDLVELQLRIAAGEALPFAQDEIQRRGAAIEARIYPEDPASMLPTAGRVKTLDEPSGYDVRVDSALYRGYEVLPHYEPLMAKLIVRGKDRDAAIARLQKALGDYVIEGVVTNIPLVSRVLARRRFTSASYATGLLDEMLEQPAGATGKEHIAAIALAIALRQNEALSEMPSKWKMHGRRAAMVDRLS
ncbi:MAG: 3-methylcrotonyl-CoA carboxylase, partial [Chloroflexi bacterium]|nr:3-methylcrotonyl-CoA carboxylase [Chloroflexota bacterium]